MPELTFLQVIDLCDNVGINRPSPSPSPFDSEILIPLYLSSTSNAAIGLLRPVIVDQLKLENERSRQEDLQQLWEIDTDQTKSKPRISFAAWLDTPLKRTAAMKELCERWRDTGLFDDVCGPKKWRTEMYPVYRDPFGVHDYPGQDSDQLEDLNYAFEMERSACALFGIVTYGVHMSLYHELEDGSLQIWVPTRARTKPTWPGFLDNTVAGGIPSGMTAFDSMVKECMEEASIPEDMVRKYSRATGSISYFFRTSSGWLQPEIEYVYDMRVPAGADPSTFKPKPLDGEVESFELLDQAEVISRMRKGLFKPNCALVIIDLFIRLGYVTPDNEADFMKIITRLHGRFDYDRW